MHSIYIFIGLCTDFHLTFYCEDIDGFGFYCFLFPALCWFILSGMIISMFNKTFVEICLSWNCLIGHILMVVPLIRYHYGHNYYDYHITLWQASGPLFLTIAYIIRCTHYPEKLFINGPMHETCGSVMCAKLGGYWDTSPLRNSEKMHKLCNKYKNKTPWYFYWLPSHSLWHAFMFLHHLSRLFSWKMLLHHVNNTQCNSYY